MKVLLCAIAKMENKYIREWVEHHKNMGFTNIVLYDNNDIDGEYFEDVINDYIESGFVILKNYRGKYRIQVQSYIDCYNEFKDQYDWIGFWDIDEFIQFQYDKTISDFLRKNIFKNVSCIRLCWKQYTDNGLVTVENDNCSVLERFTEVFSEEYCLKHNIPINNFLNANTQAKSIVRTNIQNFDIDSPHVFLPVETKNAIGEKCNNSKVMLGKTPIWSNAWINHYRFKTIQEYIDNKVKRGWPTDYKNGGKNGLNINFFFKFNALTKDKKEYVINNYINENVVYVNSYIKQDKFSGEILHNNFGDELNFNFIPLLLNKEIVPLDVDFIKNYTFIGSILNDQFITPKTEVWGSGVQDISKPLTKKPLKVHAVRGPLTRKFLLDNNIECPEVYGDPALLLPMVYNPDIEKKYKIGIVPHWRTKSLEKYNILNENGVVLIDLHNYTEWTDVIDLILSCDYIVSESLHGLIIAEAYGIPNLWVDIDLNHIYDIKFHDFFLSLKKDRETSYKLTPKTNIYNLLSKLYCYKKGEMVDLEKLIKSCPFKINRKFTRKKNINSYKMHSNIEMINERRAKLIDRLREIKSLKDNPSSDSDVQR